MVQYIHVDVKNIDLQIKNTKSMFFIFIKKNYKTCIKWCHTANLILLSKPLFKKLSASTAEWQRVQNVFQDP